MTGDLQRLKVLAKKIKAVFFDIDGTLVSFKTHKIHPSNLQALEELRAMGIKVFVCTGRMVKMTAVLDGVGFDGFIANNGATCYIPYTEEDAAADIAPLTVGSRRLRMIANRPLPQSQLAAIKARLGRKDLPNFQISFMGAEDYYLNEPSEVALRIAEEISVAPPAVTPLEEILKKDIYQLCIYLFGKELEEVMKFLPECEAAVWHPLFADVNQKGINKAYGIDRMLEHFGLDISQSLSFGDGGNDIPMLEHTAISVAMGNAADNVIKASDYLTDTVDNDGIVKALAGLGILQGS